MLNSSSSDAARSCARVEAVRSAAVDNRAECWRFRARGDSVPSRLNRPERDERIIGGDVEPGIGGPGPRTIGGVPPWLLEEGESSNRVDSSRSLVWQLPQTEPGEKPCAPASDPNVGSYPTVSPSSKPSSGKYSAEGPCDPSGAC
eukprot:CAMPEP_0115855882 /NCGR_PEP_ID=MMETSP0287-20121206/14769_1 /TAXON_ID=412157 /ORGANISM="Chrysochromulina rotalis, Strain UIO044" /LENGTH=144 /DNA_ID=CAMNT_0003310045 /DNA_START=321 /DNA_END=752 /DNA_ORIENTATION=-